MKIFWCKKSKNFGVKKQQFCCKKIWCKKLLEFDIFGWMYPNVENLGLESARFSYCFQDV